MKASGAVKYISVWIVALCSATETILCFLVTSFADLCFAEIKMQSDKLLKSEKGKWELWWGRHVSAKTHCQHSDHSLIVKGTCHSNFSTHISSLPFGSGTYKISCRCLPVTFPSPPGTSAVTGSTEPLCRSTQRYHKPFILKSYYKYKGQSAVVLVCGILYCTL